MGKKINGNDGPVLGISSSRDLYEKLRYDSTRLCDGWHPYDAFNFLVTAWHLFNDWVVGNETEAPCGTKRRRDKLPEPMNLVLDVVRDLGNGSKHFQLRPSSASRRRVEEIHTGEEMDYFEYFFHEDLPGVTADEHWYFSIRILHNLMMRYFEWVFDDSVRAEAFPEDLLDAILYCNIATRRGGPSPEVWLRLIETAYR